MSPCWPPPQWRQPDLIESLLGWLSSLPPLAVYAVLALLALLENIVPPVPADTAVALGAFLSNRGVTSLPAVYAVTLVANLGGAAAVYLAARRYGRRLFSTALGRRLLSPEALLAAEREYLRFGIVGIFIGRFLPGIRAVVAPFAGLAGLKTVRALVPMSLASALWYALVSAIGAAIGARWESIVALMSGLNQTLGILAAMLFGVGLVFYLRRRRKSGRETLWGLLRRAMGPATDTRTGDEAMRDAALLMLELTYTDGTLPEAEQREVETHWRSRWGLERRPLADGMFGKLADHRERLREHFAHERRLALVERLWQLAFERGAGQAARDTLARRAGEALGFSQAELDQVAERIRGGAEP